MNAKGQYTLLVVDDDPMILRSVSRTVSRMGFVVLTARSGEEGLQILDHEDVDVALVDQGLPGLLGVDVIEQARTRHPNVDFILFTGSGDVAVGFAALKKGASDYFTKPIEDTGRFMQVLRRGAEAKRLREENASLRDARLIGTGPADRLLLGNSAVMQALRERVRRFAKADETVLITGESGVGKDVVARAISAESGRPGAYVAINCPAIPQQLFESELFGHEPGAFTGAVKRKIGVFEEVGEGTLFLDEIGDLPLEMQVKLLRVLENRTFRRVGGSKDLEFRGRIIAATNQALPSMVDDGRFRQDLFFRLNTLQINVPSLREHREDVSMLAYYFAKQHADTARRNIKDIHGESLRGLMAHDWPGNVRQLKNAISRMVIMSDGEEIGPAGLDPEILAAGRAASRAPEQPRPQPAQAMVHEGGPTGASGGQWLPETLLDMDYQEAKTEATALFARWYLDAVLRRNGGNNTRAAEDAGLRRPNFCRELKKYDVSRPVGNDEVE